MYAAQLAEMDRRVAELEAAIGDLRTAAASSAVAGLPVAASGATFTRKTLQTHAAQFLAKQGATAGQIAVDASGALDGAALDAALVSLSVEQRIAVKSQMLRAGMLG